MYKIFTSLVLDSECREVCNRYGVFLPIFLSTFLPEIVRKCIRKPTKDFFFNNLDLVGA